MPTRRDALCGLSAGLISLSGCLHAVGVAGRTTRIRSLQVKVKDETSSHSIGLVAERNDEVVF